MEGIGSKLNSAYLFRKQEMYAKLSAPTSEKILNGFLKDQLHAILRIDLLAGLLESKFANYVH